jgi:hypothetical protein
MPCSVFLNIFALFCSSSDKSLDDDFLAAPANPIIAFFLGTSNGFLLLVGPVSNLRFELTVIGNAPFSSNSTLICSSYFTLGWKPMQAIF